MDPAPLLEVTAEQRVAARRVIERMCPDDRVAISAALGLTGETDE